MDKSYIESHWANVTVALVFLLLAVMFGVYNIQPKKESTYRVVYERVGYYDYGVYRKECEESDIRGDWKWFVDIKEDLFLSSKWFVSSKWLPLYELCASSKEAANAKLSQHILSMSISNTSHDNAQNITATVNKEVIYDR